MRKPHSSNPNTPAICPTDDPALEDGPVARLLESAAALPRIPEAASRAYSAARPELLQLLNQRMQKDPRYAEWLGDNSPQLLVDNHRHACQFMEEVFAGSRFDLLAVSLPWVYHIYSTRKVPLDYFKAEVAQWKSVVNELLDPEQATALTPVFDWMLSQHERVIEIANARREPGERVDPARAALFNDLLEAALAFDDRRVLALCSGARDGGMRLPEILNSLIYKLMHRVGEFWENGQITVADEHQITAIINRVLASLYFDQEFPAPHRGVALVASSVNEYHEMGAWMVAICLELDGWDIEYLGANVPQDALLEKAMAVQPDLVALSVSMPFNLGATRKLIAALRHRLPAVRVMIGGQVFNMLPRLAEGMGADVCLHDAEAAVQWAREQIPTSRLPTP